MWGSLRLAPIKLDYPNVKFLNAIINSYFTISLRAPYRLAAQMDVARDADGHFTRIATRYDEMCRFMYEPTAKLAVKYLQLEPDDLLGDVGGGTGEISHLVWKTAGQ